MYSNKSDKVNVRIAKVKSYRNLLAKKGRKGKVNKQTQVRRVYNNVGRFDMMLNFAVLSSIYDVCLG